MPKALIHYAAYRGHVVGLRRELAAGVSPNVPDSMQCTPLHLLCHFGGVWPAVVYGEDYDEATAVMDYVECCRLLIEAGTNVNACKGGGGACFLPHLDWDCVSTTTSKGRETLVRGTSHPPNDNPRGNDLNEVL